MKAIVTVVGKDQVGIIAGVCIQLADYNVNVLSGDFLLGETISIFRGESTASADRIGRGEINRKNPTAVTGSGSIVSIAVQNGDTVKKGDLLFETLDGSFDGLYMSGTQIAADVAGTAMAAMLASTISVSTRLMNFLNIGNYLLKTFRDSSRHIDYTTIVSKLQYFLQTIV